jgi:predicted RNA-binding Zn ribbon-like protein
MTVEIQDSGRAPAPGALVLVQRFVNTYDCEEGRDEISSPARLQEWLQAQGLPGAETLPSIETTRRVLEVREALRDLICANNGCELKPSAVETLNRATDAASLRVRFAGDGSSELQSEAPGVDATLARVLGAVFAANVDGTWPRLKGCRDDTCRWVFYDHSKNHSGAWCSMAVCGNRTKTRAYRRRRGASAA